MLIYNMSIRCFCENSFQTKIKDEKTKENQKKLNSVAEFPFIPKIYSFLGFEQSELSINFT